MCPQEQIVPKKRKVAKLNEQKLSFDIATVFSPADIKSEDIADIDQEYSLYKARKGQGGNRGMGGSGPRAPII